MTAGKSKHDLRRLLCRKSVLLACVGTELRSDDRAGLEFYRTLKKIKPDAPAIECEFGLENCLDEILRLMPETLIVVDAVLPEGGGAEGGDVILAPADSAVMTSVPASTHNIPLPTILKFLQSSGCCRETYILGVVAKDLSVGEDATPEVLNAVKALAEAVADALNACGEPS